MLLPSASSDTHCNRSEWEEGMRCLWSLSSLFSRPAIYTFDRNRAWWMKIKPIVESFAGKCREVGSFPTCLLGEDSTQTPSLGCTADRWMACWSRTSMGETMHEWCNGRLLCSRGKEIAESKYWKGSIHLRCYQVFMPSLIDFSSNTLWKGMESVSALLI